MAVFCLLHGLWHDSSSWDRVTQRLRAMGHDVVAPELPFDLPGRSYEQRAQPALDAVKGAGDELVVVGHSVASAEAGLVATSCRASLLVYLCPRLGEYPAPAGAPPVFREGFPFPPRREDGAMVWEPAAAITAMYPRVEGATAAELAARLRPGAAPLGSYPQAAPPDVPMALIYTIEDEFFTPEWERFVARELLHVNPIEMEGGHFPMAERPDELADVLDRLARE
jgi:pimeloyl-ACP methyl ester carboxylesterase